MRVKSLFKQKMILDRQTLNNEAFFVIKTFECGFLLVHRALLKASNKTFNLDLI
jgi:hypothetical protein